MAVRATWLSRTLVKGGPELLPGGPALGDGESVLAGGGAVLMAEVMRPFS
jgi:hypothetical protein